MVAMAPLPHCITGETDLLQDSNDVLRSAASTVVKVPSAERLQVTRTTSACTTTCDGTSSAISHPAIATLTSSSTVLTDVQDVEDHKTRPNFENSRTVCALRQSRTLDLAKAVPTRVKLSLSFDAKLPEDEEMNRVRSVTHPQFKSLQNSEDHEHSASSKLRRLKYARRKGLNDGSKCFVMQDDKLWIRLPGHGSFASLSALQPNIFHELKEQRRASRIIPPLACFRRSGDLTSISSSSFISSPSIISSSSFISLGDISVSESTRRSLSRLFDEDFDVQVARKRRSGDSMILDHFTPLGESPTHSPFPPICSNPQDRQGECIVLSDSEYPPVELPPWLRPRFDSLDSGSAFSDISED